MITPEKLLEAAKQLEPQLQEWRRTLHRHPEVGFDLPQTKALVKKALTEMGYAPQDCGKCGVLALAGGKKPGKVILLRGDMDALPLQEESGEEFASELPGKMHGCGHDMHTAMMLGAAKLLKGIVEYEQPQAYIVNSTDYDDRYLTPVLTAGKSFVIGYTNETEGIYQNTPCIIFDDFTTDSKLVDFPFKVKSSAMKILKVADDIEIEYVAMFMNITRLIGDTHKRYWISEYSKLCIPIPPKEEQKRIINAANAMFEKLDAIIESL